MTVEMSQMQNSESKMLFILSAQWLDYNNGLFQMFICRTYYLCSYNTCHIMLRCGGDALQPIFILIIGLFFNWAHEYDTAHKEQ